MFKRSFYLVSIFVVLAFMFGCGASLAAPSDLKVENNQLLFTEVEGAFGYQVSLTLNGEEEILDIESGALISGLCSQQGTYTIKVRALDDSANASKWSTEITFDTANLKLAAPGNVAINNNRLTWDSVNGASSYNVYFVDGNGNEVVKSLSSNCLLTNLGLSAGSYTITIVAVSADANVASSDRSASVSYNLELKQLSVPSGLFIEDGFVFFNVMGQTNKYLLKFKSGSTEITREVEGGSVEIAELLIRVGSYEVSIKALGDNVLYKDSEFSEPITFTKEVTIMTLAQKDLINAGYVKWMGRTYYNEATQCNEVYHSASGFEIFFKGSTVTATIHATNYSNGVMRPYIVIVIDDDFDHAVTLALEKEKQIVTLVSNNSDAGEHKIDLYKRSESIDSHITIENIQTDGVFIKKIVEKDLKIEVIAASSSTGYGNLGNPSSGKSTGNSDALHAYAFLTAQKLNADVNIFSASGWGCKASPWVTPNTKNVPDSYPYVDFDSKIPWIPDKYVPDIIVVNLGTNDYSYIKAASGAEYDKRMADFQLKYVEFLKYLHGLYPNAQLVVVYGLMGETSIYNETEQIVANARVAIPNLGCIKILGDAQGYNSHPSAACHEKIATELAAYLKTLLNIK